MNKQQKTIVTKWAKALRSGEYKQGMRTLNKQDARSGQHLWCCLGVLCDLAVAEGVISPPTTVEYGAVLYGYGNKNVATRTKKVGFSTGLIPSDVVRWVGLQTADGTFHIPTGNTSLAAANDSGMNFESIADLIESKPEGLFY